MSILEFPRVYFRGEIAWDPVTTNNYAVGDAAAAYDENACDSYLNQSRVLTPEVAGFRQAAIQEVLTGGSWNPAGTYRCPFYDTYISGVDLGAGLVTTDTFATAPVGFTGMLVDCEPYGAFSSQLFFDDMSFGIQGGCRIYGKRIERFNDRFVNFSANPSNNMIAGVASVMWQSCFAKGAGLDIDAHDSLALQRLKACMMADDVLGVMVRFVTYRTVYYNDPTLANGLPKTAAAARALQNKLNSGGFQPNPARSLLVGTVGLWRSGEVITEASDRALISTMATVPGYSSPAKGGPVVATAFARTNDKGISLDFSNSIPCSDRATDKVDLGTLTLTAADPPPAVAIAEVAKIDLSHYDRAAFEASSGIIDIPLDAGLTKQLAKMNLSITGGDGTTYLQEAVLRAVPLQANIYIDEGETANIPVQVYERGVPAGPGITITMSDLNATQQTSVQQLTDANGRVNFRVLGTTGEIIGWVFQTGDHPILPVGNVFTPLNFTYTYLRVLPADNNVAAMAPTWENVHNYVLANWESMAPCMDNWLRLGDEQQVRAYRNVIRTLTDPANFENFRYMPVTRDLTMGQRTLLYNFLGFGTTRATLENADASDEHIDARTQSRSMRVGRKD
ncbi:MAG: hypothetical protein IT473_08875 [Lysobacter sp.]|nr:hypothetical protein [Lysobacter sp.]